MVWEKPGHTYSVLSTVVDVDHWAVEYWQTNARKRIDITLFMETPLILTMIDFEL